MFQNEKEDMKQIIWLIFYEIIVDNERVAGLFYQLK